MLEKIKENWKNYALLALLAIALIALILANYYHGKIVTKQQNANAKAIIANPTADIIDRYTDSLQQNHAAINASQNTVTAASMKDTANTHKSKLDTIAKAVGLSNVSQIQEVTQENIELKAQNLKLKKSLDSAGNALLSYTDKHMHLTYNPRDSTLNWTYNVNLTSVRYNKPTWLPFIKGASILDFYTDDPRVTINGVNHLTVQQTDPLLGISGNVKASYDFNSGRVIPSAGVDFRVGHTIFGTRYYYSFRDKQFKPMASVSYNIGHL